MSYRPMKITFAWLFNIKAIIGLIYTAFQGFMIDAIIGAGFPAPTTQYPIYLYLISKVGYEGLLQWDMSIFAKFYHLHFYDFKNEDEKMLLG